MLQTRVDSGLDGVIVADTVMSEVDGEAGRLVVRGHALEELVATRGFEGVAALLWHGYAAGGGDAKAVAEGLGAARVRAFAEVPKLLAATTGLTPVEALRVGLGLLPDSEPMPHHYLVCGAMPVFLAALLNAAKGMAPIAPDPTLSTAQDLLRMIRGQRAASPREGPRHLSRDRQTMASTPRLSPPGPVPTHAGLISAAGRPRALKALAWRRAGAGAHAG
jgi:citrate synthase